MSAGQDQAPNAPQLDAVQWRMLCAIAHDAVATARTRGLEIVVFHGYRVAARRVEAGGTVVIEVTVRPPLAAELAFAARVRTEVAIPFKAEPASVIAWRCACGRVVCAELPSAG